MYSVQRVVSDGSLQVVDLSFYYFDRSEIAVYINSELYTDWQWASDVEDRIIFNEPIPAGIEVLIKRTTDLSKLRHYFSKGSAFTAEALDEDLQQVLHIAQEATEANLSGNFYADINMHGHRVRNIGPAVDDSDALTLRQYKQDAQGAWQARERAVQAEQNAAASASSAAQSATNAAASAASAAQSATNAAASTSAAAQSATNAATSASSAAASATAAAASFDAFDDRYLGAKPNDPVTDNDGNALQVGALYWNTTINEMRVWNGSSWRVAVGSLVGNADTATRLQTARTITIGNTGKSFDGAADVSWSLDEIGVPAKDGTGATGTWGVSVSGNADTATKLQTARTITIGNTGKSFDGSADVTWTLAEIGVNAATETASGIVKLATATEAQALASAVVALTPARLADAFKGENQSLSANGYQKLPGGLIIQWGTREGDGSVTFPIAFPNAVFQLAFSVNTATSGATPSCNTLSTTGATFDWVGMTLISPFRYIVVGY
jgi:hypothetical protein